MFAGPDHRANFGTISTGSAFGDINVARLLFERQLKTARFALHIEDIGIGENLDIGMVGQFRQFRAHHARRAVVGRKGLVELSHDAAHIRLFFHQMHFKAGIGDIQGGLDPCNAAADNRDRSDFAGMLSWLAVTHLFINFGL